MLGAPDLIVLTLSEFAEQAYRINRAGALPLLVDADHGYGNSLNVKRTVEELETAGVAALALLLQPSATTRHTISKRPCLVSRALRCVFIPGALLKVSWDCFHPHLTRRPGGVHKVLGFDT